MKRLTLLVLAAWLLAAASGNILAAGGAKPQGVSRPAPGVSRPVTPSKSITPKERRRIVKGRIAHLRKAIAKAEQRAVNVQNAKRRRSLKVRADFLRIRLAGLLRFERYLNHRLPRKR